MTNHKFLFVLKRREKPDHDHGHHHHYHDGRSSGLLNSAKFVSKMLWDAGVNSEVVQVTDNNDIDREITRYRPTHVVVEAFWVVPEKFDILKRLHPGVTFIVRNHSETSFLAQEGIAIDWILGYLKRGITVAANSISMIADSKALAEAHGLWLHQNFIEYLPNYYPLEVIKVRQMEPFSEPNTLNVGCFGAIRPMKNHLQQALAAIDYATSNGLKLRFHVNGTRVELGDSVIKNLRSAFQDSAHVLVEHPWVDHNEFLQLVCSMDINLCVSLSESFCIVAADSVAQGVPTVGSPEIEWLSSSSKASPTDAKSISRAMDCALNGFFANSIKRQNRKSLQRNVNTAKEHWLNYVRQS